MRSLSWSQTARYSVGSPVITLDPGSWRRKSTALLRCTGRTVLLRTWCTDTTGNGESPARGKLPASVPATVSVVDLTFAVQPCRVAKSVRLQFFCVAHAIHCAAVTKLS